MKKITINSDGSLSHAVGVIRDLFKTKKYFQIEFTLGKKRSLNLNAISHVWYAQVANEEREYTAGHVKNLCKYSYGLPILRGEDSEDGRKFNEFCVKYIDHYNYEDRVEAMEHLDVTSLMKSKQFLLYMEQVQAHYAGRVPLEYPKDNE